MRTIIRREAIAKGCCAWVLFFLRNYYLKSLTFRGAECPIQRRPLDYILLPQRDQNGPTLRILHEGLFYLSRKSQ